MTRLEALGPDPKTGCCRWLLRLGPGEAAVVRERPDRFARVLADPDCNRAVIERLFPSSYDDPAQAYPAQPIPEIAPRYSDYDHLARLARGAGSGS